MQTTLLYAVVLHIAQALTALNAAPASAPASAPKATDAAQGASAVDSAGGLALRIETPEGPVRLWRPPHYDPATASTVVYVHGYKRSADAVWSVGDLPRQFLASGRNALFVVPTTADSDRAPLRWGRLGALLHAVSQAGVALPAGSVVAVGHSGAYRTLSHWVDEPRLEAVVLLDALYGQDEAFARFARRGRLVLVAHCTAARTERFLRRFGPVPRRDALPAEAAFTAEERAAPVVYFNTRLGHAALNDGGAAIPPLLTLALPDRTDPTVWLAGGVARAN